MSFEATVVDDVKGALQNQKIKAINDNGEHTVTIEYGWVAVVHVTSISGAAEVDIVGYMTAADTDDTGVTGEDNGLPTITASSTQTIFVLQRYRRVKVTISSNTADTVIVLVSLQPSEREVVE